MPINWYLKIPINIPVIGKEEVEESRSVLLEKSLTSAANSGGRRVQEFEKLLSSFVKSRYAVAVNSGTSALQAALYALDLKKGDEVLLPSFTFVATANAVVSVGAKPDFVDILKQNYTMDPNHLRKKIGIPETNFFIAMEHCGNTVSSTIPIAICEAIKQGKFTSIKNCIIEGFGVGYSWAACNLYKD